MNQSKHPVKKNDNKYAKTAGIIIGILLVIAIILGLLHGCENEKPVVTPDDSTNSGIVYDDDATEGCWDEADTNKIIESPNEKVEEGMINISRNTSPTVPTALPLVI